RAGDAAGQDDRRLDGRKAARVQDLARTKVLDLRHLRSPRRGGYAARGVACTTTTHTSDRIGMTGMMRSRRRPAADTSASISRRVRRGLFFTSRPSPRRTARPKLLSVYG